MNSALKIALATLLCASEAGREPASVSSVTGYYELIAGGYNEEVALHLKSDGTYILDHSVLFHDISGRDVGKWTIKDDAVMLTPEVIGTERSELFLPRHLPVLEVRIKGDTVFLRSRSVPRIPAASPTRAVLERKAAEPGATDNPAYAPRI